MNPNTTIHKLRPTVEAFAQHMEAALKRHDDERGTEGWRDSTDAMLFEALVEHVVKLGAVLQACGNCTRAAADVANFAMMLADNVEVGTQVRKASADDTMNAALEVADVIHACMRAAGPRS